MWYNCNHFVVNEVIKRLGDFTDGKKVLVLLQNKYKLLASITASLFLHVSEFSRCIRTNEILS